MFRRCFPHSSPYIECLNTQHYETYNEWHWLLERNANLGHSQYEIRVNTTRSHSCPGFREISFCLLVFSCTALLVPVGCDKTEQQTKLWLRNKSQNVLFWDYYFGVARSTVQVSRRSWFHVGLLVDVVALEQTFLSSFYGFSPLIIISPL
jgi:hypothetical protein